MEFSRTCVKYLCRQHISFSLPAVSCCTLSFYIFFLALYSLFMSPLLVFYPTGHIHRGPQFHGAVGDVVRDAAWPRWNRYPDWKKLRCSIEWEALSLLSLDSWFVWTDMLLIIPQMHIWGPAEDFPQSGWAKDVATGIIPEKQAAVSEHEKAWLK